MHELALAEGILAVALDVADGRPVRCIRVRVGALQLVVPDSLDFCFQLATADTSADGARLEQLEVPARVRCTRCAAESEAASAPFQCRVCGSFDVEVTAGDEILVDAVELDDGWRYRPGSDDGATPTLRVPADHLAEHARAHAERPEPDELPRRRG
jgi:hydrogenase nickel incorporation protein HypA/HybF